MLHFLKHLSYLLLLPTCLGNNAQPDLAQTTLLSDSTQVDEKLYLTYTGGGIFVLPPINLNNQYYDRVMG